MIPFGISWPGFRRSAADRRFRGIGGWLALLIFWMVILRPLAGVILWQQMHAQALADPGAIEKGGWVVNTSFFWINILGLAALSIYGGLRLWRDRTPAAVRAAILILWITIPIAAGALLIFEAYVQGGVTWADAALRVFSNALVAAVWTAYLLRSRRVKQIYGAAPAG